MVQLLLDLAEEVLRKRQRLAHLRCQAAAELGVALEQRATLRAAREVLFHPLFRRQFAVHEGIANFRAVHHLLPATLGLPSCMLSGSKAASPSRARSAT